MNFNQVQKGLRKLSAELKGERPPRRPRRLRAETVGAAVLICLGLAAAGCSVPPQAVTEPAATSLPAATTMMPTPTGEQPLIVVSGPTAEASHLPEPTGTAQGELRASIAASRAWMYGGPGLDYALADPNPHPQGEELAVVAKDPSGTWLLCSAANGTEGWLYFQWLEFGFDPSTVPAASTIPAPPPPPGRKPKGNSCPPPPGCQYWDPVACVCNG